VGGERPQGVSVLVPSLFIVISLKPKQVETNHRP
jgi:hypothetical protein